MRAKPCFATAHDPMHANRATMTPDGIVVLLPPAPLLATRSGPHTAETATATHIAVIAKDAHVSATRSCTVRGRRSATTPDGGCEIVDTFTSLSC